MKEGLPVPGGLLRLYPRDGGFSLQRPLPRGAERGALPLMAPPPRDDAPPLRTEGALYDRCGAPLFMRGVADGLLVRLPLDGDTPRLLGTVPRDL